MRVRVNMSTSRTAPIDDRVTASSGNGAPSEEIMVSKVAINSTHEMSKENYLTSSRQVIMAARGTEVPLNSNLTNCTIGLYVRCI